MNARVGRTIGIVAITVGVAWYTFSAISPRYPASTTDFERDLVGAMAVNAGVQPYQTLGALASQVPGVQVPVSDHDEWVAHSPASLAGARLMLWVFGDAANSVAAGVVILTTFVLVGAIAGRARDSGHWAPWLLLAAALLLSVGVEQDLMWVQGSALLALILGGVLMMDVYGRHGLAVVLLGLAVAWRPWCAPLALFLPSAKRPIFDASRVGLVAVMATVAVTPAVGGWRSLVEWVSVALPENSSQYLPDPWNIAVTDALWPVGVAIAGVGLVVMALVILNRVDLDLRSRIGAVATLSWLPLVWPHYWVALLPGLLPSRTSHDAQPLILSAAFLALSVPFAGISPSFSQVASVLALALTVVGILLAVRSQESYVTSDTEGATKDPGVRLVREKSPGR